MFAVERRRVERAEANLAAAFVYDPFAGRPPILRESNARRLLHHIIEWSLKVGQDRDALVLALDGGRVTLSYNLGSGVGKLTSNGARYNDGKWHM